jgi:flagellar basal-body rod protein FlgC
MMVYQLSQGASMVSAINIALSGLNAAGRRLEVSANNLANQFSTQSVGSDGSVQDTPFSARRVDQVSLSGGGVLAQVSNADPGTVDVADGQGGLQTVPNVDTASELIQTRLASYDFKANLKTIQAQDTLFKSLLDIVS